MPLSPIKPEPHQWPNWCRDASMNYHRANRLTAEETLEFGRFQLLPRRRELASQGVPIELGARAFELLLVLLEADGALVSKAELLRRVWRGTFVAEENLKVQISALRKAFGEDRDLIRTEFGRGYRFTATVRSQPRCAAARRPAERQRHRSSPQSSRWSPSRRSAYGW
jgi:DNA-binding winged helix-turn-helix (wHTH) protein